MHLVKMYIFYHLLLSALLSRFFQVALLYILVLSLSLRSNCYIYLLLLLCYYIFLLFVLWFLLMFRALFAILIYMLINIIVKNNIATSTISVIAPFSDFGFIFIGLPPFFRADRCVRPYVFILGLAFDVRVAEDGDPYRFFDCSSFTVYNFIVCFDFLTI